MEYQAYPEYKSVDVEWLDTIPIKWSAKRLRFVVRTNPVKSEINQLDADDLVSFIPMEAVGEYGGMALESEKPLSDVYNGYTYFIEGDVVIAKITPCFENGKGAIAEGLANGIGFGTTEFHVLRSTEDCCTSFMFYLSMSHTFRNIGESEMLGAGGQKRIPELFIKDFYAGIPSKNEQESIADFLDYKTQQIDQLIEKKKVLIEKLNEQRIAAITQAVTKGLDKNAKMKPSGVGWLGDVPAHWELTRLKFGVDFRNTKIEAKETDLPYMGMENIESFTAKKIYDEGNPSQSDGVGTYYKKGDVLFGKLRPYLAKAYLSDSEGFCSSELLVLRSRTFIPEYLVNLVLSDWFIEIVNSSTYGAKMPRANWDYISNLVCPVPEGQEQKRIVSYISVQTKRIEKLTQAAISVIGKMEPKSCTHFS